MAAEATRAPQQGPANELAAVPTPTGLAAAELAAHSRLAPVRECTAGVRVNQYSTNTNTPTPTPTPNNNSITTSNTSTSIMMFVIDCNGLP